MAKAKKAREGGKTTGKKRAAGESGKPSILNKITVKTVVGKVIFDEDAADGDEIELMTIAGFVRGTKHGEGDKGEWIALLGSFEAQRASDGKMFAAPKCFLPKAATDLIVDAFNQALQASAEYAKTHEGVVPHKPEIKFAFKIGARSDETISVGYTYTCEPLVKEENDQMAALRGEVFQQLTGPKS